MYAHYKRPLGRHVAVK